MRGMADRSSALLWLMALAGACAAAEGQAMGDQGGEDYHGASLSPKSSPKSSPYPPVTYDVMLPAPPPRKDPSSMQHQPMSTKMKMASNSSDDECGGSPKKSKRPKAEKDSEPAKKPLKKGSRSKGPKTTPPCPGSPAAKAGATAAAQGPAVDGPGASFEGAADRGSGEQICVFVCLVDVACSKESTQCSTMVFLAGSYWCRFDYKCPAFDPPFTVTYIPYKPPDAPTSTGTQMVIVDPPDAEDSSGVAVADGELAPSGSRAMAPAAAAAMATTVSTSGSSAAAASEPAQNASKVMAPAPAVINDTALGPVEQNDTIAFSPGTAMSPALSSEAPSPLFTGLEGGPKSPGPQSPKVPKAAGIPVAGDKSQAPVPPAAQCFYVCKREICSSDNCEVVEGSGFCTFWAMCPPNPPSSRIIHLPQDAETDPPGTIVAATGAQTPGPLPGLNPAAAPG